MFPKVSNQQICDTFVDFADEISQKYPPKIVKIGKVPLAFG